MPHSPPWAGVVAAEHRRRRVGTHTSLARRPARAAVAPARDPRVPALAHALPHSFAASTRGRNGLDAVHDDEDRVVEQRSWTMRLPIVALLASSGQSHAGSS